LQHATLKKRPVTKMLEESISRQQKRAKENGIRCVHGLTGTQMLSSDDGRERPRDTMGSPFSCQICPQQFRRKYDLKTHIEAVRKYKPYEQQTCNLVCVKKALRI
jgi:hypothetical protein